MNSVNLIGWLTADPQLHKMGDSDRDVCELRIAVDNGAARDGSQHDPTYIDVSTFDGAARACAQHLSKGREVGVQGRLVYRQWEAEDGSKRSKYSVIGRVDFLGSKNGSSPQGGSASEPAAVGAADDGIPF